ncbi:M48 family metalloprotease [Aurantiacibacter rhizosphaerae]|uniref:PDZ domain-containing protein n=1 Tax=Aurantiacibacter rhizosphaerae TaxID=2691582 RepID=A0A844XEN9_9SPHN|nr:M48 family metallopeptidase [Aurantiacibacter rhizosphaerae]MWV28064.1 PDZ domain-containing protein [Aurantiacibacter rhizosphaerae]
MRKLIALLCAMMWLALATGAQAQNADLAAQDLRLARIADAMLVSNVKLCRETMPVTGMILHSADQYGNAAPSLFRNGSLAIAAVVPGSTAERAGLKSGDGIAAVNGVSVNSMVPTGKDHLREVAFFQLAGLAPEASVELTILRDGETRSVGFDAPQGCQSLVEVLPSGDFSARSNGRVIQVQYDFLLSLSDDQLAVILAHELSHSVLEHRRRKVEAGIDNASIMRHLGRNQQVNRQAEIEADRLSVHILANAGYDAAIAPAFWRSEQGLVAGGGAIPSFIYPTQSARAAMIEQEIARYLPLGHGPSWPGHLLRLRDASFAGDQAF